MAITSADLLNPNKNDRNNALFGSMGFDPKGNNEIGAWLRRLAQASGVSAAGGLGLQNELDPQRQGAIRALVNINNPANMIQQAKGAGAGLQARGNEAGTINAQRIAQSGGGLGAQLGAQVAGQNAGIDASNQLLLNAYSPQAQSQALEMQVNVADQAAGPGLQQLLQMFAPIEQRSATNAAQKAQGGLGGFGSLLGSVLPMIGTGFGGPAGGALGSAVSGALGGTGAGMAGAGTNPWGFLTNWR